MQIVEELHFTRTKSNGHYIIDYFISSFSVSLSPFKFQRDMEVSNDVICATVELR